jgi:hypothetical protein
MRVLSIEPYYVFVYIFFLNGKHFMTTPSPCVGICILEDDVCIGCGRTSDEIFAAGVAAGYGQPAGQSDDEKEDSEES